MPCAQRLSASEEGSPGYLSPWQKAMACSTPFGIRGRITLHGICCAQLDHGCSTPFGIRGRITEMTAKGDDIRL